MTDLRSLADEHLRVAQGFTRASLPDVERLAEMVVAALAEGHKILTFGNGGSAADAQHFAAELLGHFRADRRPLAAMALSTDTSTLTAIGNDYAFDEVFARQAAALAEPGDVAIGITTSGSSENVRRGLRAARERGARTVAMTGSGGDIGPLADLVIAVPSDVTARIQEMHLLTIHLVCERIDEWAAGA